MFKNVFYDTKRSIIHVWDEAGHSEKEWVPYIYIPGGDGSTKNLAGEPVHKRSFGDYNEYYNFAKEYTGEIYENKVRPEIQWLADEYHNIPDEDIPVPKLLIYYLDIEVAYQDEFPKPSLAQYPICLISIRN